MRKVIALLICACAVFCLVACGSTNNQKGDFDINSVKTLGDALKLDVNGSSYAYSTDKYVMVFEYKGAKYRVIANITEELSNKLDEIDYYDNQREEKFRNILSDVQVISAENLTAQLPTTEQLNAYVGKTGKELLDDGFVYEGFDSNGQVFYMDKGVASLYVFFNETVEYSDDFDPYAVLNDMTVKKIDLVGVTNNAVDQIFSGEY